MVRRALIEDQFRTLDVRLKGALAKASSPLQLGLSALAIASEQFGAEWLSPDEIARCLEAAGTAISASSIRNAFSRAGRKVARRGSGPSTRFKIMVPGLDEVRGIVAAHSNLQVLYIEGEQPRTARKRLGEILSQLSGLIRITDPYYGERSLDTLEMIPKTCQVRFLTGRTGEDGAKVHRLIADFRKERPEFDIRSYPSPSALHDRYVLSNQQLLIIGHGLKDIGTKESFIIALDRTLAYDLMQGVRSAFDTRWKSALVL